MWQNESARRWQWVTLLSLALAVPSAHGQTFDDVNNLPLPVEFGGQPPSLPPGDSVDPADPLRRPIEAAPAESTTEGDAGVERPLLRTYMDPPLGFTGRSSIVPTEVQTDDHFVPIEDRWRLGFPEWDRYDHGHPWVDDYPYIEGHWWDPYNQNVLKGDYPIMGQNTFLDITATSFMNIDARQVPTATTPFESTVNPFQEEFFGRPGQFFYTHFFSLSFDLFHGNQKAFKPVDWRIKITPVFNVNNLNVNELAIVNPNVGKGTNRGRTFWALQEWFIETKIADLSPDYDFLSMRAGSQFFNADFRGFLFFDTNRMVRLFGTTQSNRNEFNIIWTDQMEKDTNSELNNIFRDRNQNILIANFYRQDFIFKGFTAEWLVGYNNDQKSFHFNKNDVLVRPDPTGVFTPHHLDVLYLGFAGFGHINRFNVVHQFYYALGRDSLNPIANSSQDINAQFAAIEVSYDRDWARLKTSFLYSSGDGNPNNKHATGFDTILDNPNFAGGEFSYFQRQAIQLFGVNLVQARSLIPDLRSSKIQGQSNFVNPGLLLFNVGVDMDLTPKLRSINNLNFLWFDKTAVLETFTFQGNIDRFIGADASLGLEYRPLLNNNIIVIGGVSTLFPGSGFHDLYNRFKAGVEPLFAGFFQLTLTY
ncbi:MAG: hypothetical protein KatS3mg105_2396 [Gemmatales bacterium]|nr:MAG: hypothetical protein KatS3mg105_2396 [Gemmatales bacterium]